MNKTTSITLLATAALMGATSPALAQSAVTLFGVMDMAARQVNNNTNVKQLAASGLTSSRFGVRGGEDLGGGLKADFWLEGALEADTGAGGTWQRRSTIGLSGNFGEVRLGRTKNPTGLNWEQFDIFGATGMGSSDRLQAPVLPAGGAYQSFSGSSNSVNYYTPGSTGFFGEATAAAGEAVPGNKYTGVRLGYRSAALLVAGAYGTTQVTGSVDAKMLNIGASYDMKSANFTAFYNTTDVGPADQNNLLVSVSVPIGSWAMRASYQKMDGGGSISNRSAKMAALSATYNLSRRTALYSTYAKISNTGTSYSVAAGSPLSTGIGSSGYELGLRHSF